MTATLTPEPGLPASGELPASTARYIDAFPGFQASRSPSEPGFVRQLRQRGIERFRELGFPTTRDEEWRFTSVKPVAESSFALPGPDESASGSVETAALAPHLYGTGSRLVFVDGAFTPELSVLDRLPEGITVTSLAAALREQPERLEAHLARHARLGEHPFVALNSAFFTDGAVVLAGRGKVVEEPIQILHVATGRERDGRQLVTYPRNLIVAAEASQVTVVESFVSLTEAAYFTCPVTEVVAEAGAVIDHYRVQKESVAAFHLATLQIQVERAANVFSHSISTGGALVRNDVNAIFGGEGAECTLNGLYVLRGNQFLDNHMRVDHAEPHCNSYELFKGILDERSRAVFNGRIYVAEGAQKTDAKQSSRNLLLSREALVNANPQLEIYADDVKCTHGSTVGQLDEEAIFYLRSRGIGKEAARSILTYAFASDIVERIKVEPVRKELTEFLFERLPRGEIVRQAV